MSLKKTAKLESPHAIFYGNSFEYRVLKTYKTPPAEEKDPYARWLLGTRSPYTFGSHELGDGYAAEVRLYARLVAATDEWLIAYAGVAVDLQMARSTILTPEEYIASQQGSQS